MRAQRRTTKKLIVAFHFQSSNQAAWKCESCRRSGLEQKRRCGFLPPKAAGPASVVWARRRVSMNECPRSYVTADSQTWIEYYYAARYFGVADMYALPATTVDAICTIEGEINEEKRHGDR